MPSFNFSVTNTNKNKKLKTTDINVILTKGVTGIVHIRLDATYYVKSDGVKYEITSKSFSCKGKTKVYKRLHGFCRWLYIRPYDKLNECHPLIWIPFDVGCVVKGDIVKNRISNIIMFDIKHCSVDYDNIEASKAYAYYRNNRKVIVENLKCKLADEFTTSKL